MPQIPRVLFGLTGAAMAALTFPQVRRASPHPWGLAEPPLDPAALSKASWDWHGPIEITLAYGDPLEVSAPLVEVTTALPGRGGDPGAPEEALAYLAHWDAAVARRDFLALFGQPRSEPPGPAGFSDAHLILGQEPHPVSVLSFRHYQAARFADAGTMGMIVSRHCPLDQLTLAPVPAIEPYLAGCTAFWRRAGRYGFTLGRL